MDILIDPYRIRAPLKLTSRPYPVDAQDGLDCAHALTGGLVQAWPADSLQATHGMLGGALREPLFSYSDWPAEAVDVSAHGVSGGQLKVVLGRYDDWPTEAIDADHAMQGGQLKQVLYTYSQWPDEAIDAAHSLAGGSLS